MYQFTCQRNLALCIRINLEQNLTHEYLYWYCSYLRYVEQNFELHPAMK